MTSADVRDMLDLPVDGQPRPVKKQKTVEKRPEGITRELFALLGERAPPVAITEHVRYRERRKWPHKVQPWAWTPFTNPARTDGLVLHHWRKKQDPNASSRPDVNEAMDQVPQDVAPQQAGSGTGYHYAKFNVKIPRPEYTDEEYEKHLTDKDWSKGETDYLMTLAAEYDLRWVVIADRYEFNADIQVDGHGQAGAMIQIKPRSMEDMKARYYTVAAAVMALRQPLSSMSSQELEKHEKMTAFDPNQEIRRKRMAEALLSRTPEEVKEEELLLAELKRIVTNQDRLMEERKELYARLETPQTTGNNQIHQSSQGLAQLLHNLLVADKGKKRRSIIGPGETPTSAGPGGPITTPSSATKDGRESSHRESISGPSGAANKKGTAPSERRRLTPQEDDMYGVTHHERLTSGVQFRHDKVNRLAQAKSNVQAQRVANALTELGIPPRLVMPTAKVCAEYERLMQSIHALIEVRKVSEKVEGEIKVALAQRDERVRRESQSHAQLQLQLQQATSQSEHAGVGPDGFKGDEDVDMKDVPEGHVDANGMQADGAAAERVAAPGSFSNSITVQGGLNGITATTTTAATPATDPSSSTITVMPPTAGTIMSSAANNRRDAAHVAGDTEMTDASTLPHGAASISDGPFATPAAAATVAASLQRAAGAGAMGGAGHA